MKLTEAAFQRQIIDLAHLYGWRVAHFRPAQNARGDHRTPVAGDGKGFPDLVLVRDRVLFIELKTSTGQLTRDQLDWGGALLKAGATWARWRPEDWPDIEAALKPAPQGSREQAGTP